MNVVFLMGLILLKNAVIKCWQLIWLRLRRFRDCDQPAERSLAQLCSGSARGIAGMPLNDAVRADPVSSLSS